MRATDYLKRSSGPSFGSALRVGILSAGPAGHGFVLSVATARAAIGNFQVGLEVFATADAVVNGAPHTFPRTAPNPQGNRMVKPGPAQGLLFLAENGRCGRLLFCACTSPCQGDAPGCHAGWRRAWQVFWVGSGLVRTRGWSALPSLL